MAIDDNRRTTEFFGKMIFSVDNVAGIVSSRHPERRFGGIGRRARLKIEYLRVWVRVPQPLLIKEKHTFRGVLFFVSYARLTQFLWPLVVAEC